jgi:hypothetical protein
MSEGASQVKKPRTTVAPRLCPGAHQMSVRQNLAAKNKAVIHILLTVII